MILRAISDILINDVVKQNFNIITFTKLSELLSHKYGIRMTPSDIDVYLEELSMVCFAPRITSIECLGGRTKLSAESTVL